MRFCKRDAHVIFIVLKNSQCFCPPLQSGIWEMWVWFQTLLNSSCCLFCETTCIYSLSGIWDAGTFTSFLHCFSPVWMKSTEQCSLSLSIMLVVFVQSIFNPYFPHQVKCSKCCQMGTVFITSKQFLTVTVAHSEYNYCLYLVTSSKHSTR